VSNLAIDLHGEYAFYDQPERWQAQLRKHEVPSRWNLGQRIFANHSSGRFRTEVAEKTVRAGSIVHLKVKGITPYAVLAIVSGRLDNSPLEPYGRIIIPYEESLDAIVHIPSDAESGIYVFFAQQWELGGEPAYPGGSLIYPSKASSVWVRERGVELETESEQEEDLTLALTLVRGVRGESERMTEGPAVTPEEVRERREREREKRFRDSPS
jgi:hypothetical protein